MKWTTKPSVATASVTGTSCVAFLLLLLPPSLPLANSLYPSSRHARLSSCVWHASITLTTVFSLKLDRKEYWHQLFPKVTTSKISSFQTKYQRSEEERADLRAAYLRCEGDMNAILDSIMLANAIDDEERFRTDIDAWIAAGDVPSFPAYTQEKARARKKRRDTALREAEEAAEERGARATATTKGAQQAASGNDLAAMILARREERTGMWAKFEERYAQKARKKVQRGKAAPEDLEEPSEEAFLAAQARVDARRQGGSGKADKSGKRSAAAAAAGAKPPTKRKAKKG